MGNRWTLRAAVGVCLMSLLTFPAPAEAIRVLPPTGELSSKRINKLATKYLRIVCPGNAADRNWDAAFEREYGKSEDWEPGAPIPPSIREQSRIAAAAFAKSATQLQRAAWPENITYDIGEIIYWTRNNGRFFTLFDADVFPEYGILYFQDYSYSPRFVRNRLWLGKPGENCAKWETPSPAPSTP